MDKGQISRALAELVSRKLVAKTVNPRDNREVPVSLTRTGWSRMMPSWRVRWSAPNVCWKS
jgi:DNA-binding MarR family transcriptional regulator